MADFTNQKYTIKKEDFELMVQATDDWIKKYGHKRPFAVYLRHDGLKVENYISYEKYQELKAVFEEYKGIDLEIAYKAPKKRKMNN